VTKAAASVVVWDADELALRAEEVLDVYAEAMAVPRPVAGSRHSILTAHSGRAGLRAVAALTGDDELVGIAYGHLGEVGQWWHDQVLTAIRRAGGDHVRRQWTASFEVCELHVRPGWQGHGLGRQLLDQLLTPPPAPVALLTTPDQETRARGFYRAAGWVDLVRDLHFPGDPRSFAVLGLRLE
jgi:GNAT superfamily N-acetyltransferase